MYELRLDDGTRWLLRPTAETEDWLGRFASILGVPAVSCDGGARTVTFRRSSGMKRIPGGHDMQAREQAVWDFSRIPGAILEGEPAGREVACFLPRAANDEMEIEGMRHVLLPLYLETLCRGGFPVHAALVERNGRGVLLAGRGGIGKSTCCSRLRAPWAGLADDLALVVRDASGEYRAHALPTWSALRAGSEGAWDVRRSVPLEAIFFLVQAVADGAVPAGRGEAAVACRRSAMEVIWSVGPFKLEGDTLNVARRVFENAAAFSLALPAYLLRVSLTGRFWEKIEGVLDDPQAFRNAPVMRAAETKQQLT
jgi:SynChlorMet cassette protein ScmC